MKKCKKAKVHELPGLDLNKYTPFFHGKGLLKQLFTEHSQLFDAYNIKLNIQQDKVGGLEPCQDCHGTDFLRTGTCHVCVTCGASQGCS